jgi:cytochrome P450
VSGAGVPELDLDLYADDVLADSRDVFARIREAGPIVWLPRHRMYAMGRFDDVRAALRDDEVFLSGAGVAANPVTNRLSRGTTLNSDSEEHARRRRVLMRSLGAKALASVRAPLASAADDLVERLLARGGEFDAAVDFARHLPVAVVSELVGIRPDSEQMLRWAASTFDALGPINRRGVRSMRHALGLLVYSLRLRSSSVAPGSWAASVFDAQRAGELSRREVPGLIIDFVAPSLDTTILAATYTLWVLGNEPEAWAQIRSDPALIPAAVMETVRLSSPIRGFTRTLARDHEVGGHRIPRGRRIAILFGAANLDETQFPEPQRFRLDRETAAHLGWGHGPHACVGMLLAKLELRTLIDAMVPRVEAIGVGAPTPLRNNTLQGIARLPTSFTAA